LHAPPDRHTELFELGEREAIAREMDPGEQRESAGEEECQCLRRERAGRVGAGTAERAGECTGSGVARNPAGVEDELPLQHVVLSHQRKTRADAAAHAGAVKARSEPADGERERQCPAAHMTLE
jgi:hypothetical protein